MAKKIRLIDEEASGEAETTSTATPGISGTVSVEGVDGEQLMKYVEAIDWKLWELLKIARKMDPEG